MRGCLSPSVSSEETLGASSACGQPLQVCLLPAQPHQAGLWQDTLVGGPDAAQVNRSSPPTSLLTDVGCWRNFKYSQQYASPQLGDS